MQAVTTDFTINGLYIGYKDINPPHQWYPLALLTWENSEYCLEITQSGFKILDRYPGYWMAFPPECRTDGVYRGKHLPATIDKRMPSGRNDERENFEFFNLKHQQLDGIAFLSKSGGRSGIDPFDIYPQIAPDANGIHTFYFSPGILPESSEFVRQIPIGTQLQYRIEEDGSIAILKDETAIANFHPFFSHLKFTNIDLEVEQNLDKPYLGMRLLLKAKVNGKNLYSSDAFTIWNSLVYSQ
jgi:hypothetical protein